MCDKYMRYGGKLPRPLQSHVTNELQQMPPHLVERDDDEPEPLPAPQYTLAVMQPTIVRLLATATSMPDLIEKCKSAEQILNTHRRAGRLTVPVYQQLHTFLQTEGRRVATEIQRAARRTGSGLAAGTMKALLANSYAKKQAAEIDGYRRDDALSGQRASVYVHPTSGHAIVVHKGTQSLQDWGTNLLSAVGKAEQTKRFKHAEKIQKQAESKYGAANVTTIGHSLGAKIAETVGQDSKDVVTLNKPVTLENIGRKVAGKQTDVRTSRDPVSLLSGLQRGQQQVVTLPSQSYNPLTEHNTSQLGQLDAGQYLGRGLVMQKAAAHYAQYGGSFRVALHHAQGRRCR